MIRSDVRGLPGALYYPLHAIPFLLAIEWRIRVSELSFALAELAAVIAIMIAIMASGSQFKVRLPRSFILGAIVMGGAGFIGVFLQSDLKHTLSVYRDLMLPVTFYAAFLSIRLLPAQAQQLAKSFVFWSTLSSALAIAQFYTNDYLWFQSEDTAIWQEFKAPLAAESAMGQALGLTKTLPDGLCSHPNNFAAYIVIPGLVAYAMTRTSRWRSSSRWFWGSCTVVQLAALVLTFSRGSLLTFVASAVAFELLIIRKQKPRMSIVLATTGVIATLFVIAINSTLFSFDDLGSLFGRFDMLQSSLLLIAENPLALLTGGFTEIYMNRFYSYNQLVHNLFAYLTLQFGLATMLAWVLWVLADMRRVGKVVFGSIDRSRHLPGAVLIAVFFSIFLYGQTYSMLDSVQIGFWLLFWLGIARQASRRDKLCAVVVRREARFVTDPVVPRQVALTEVT